ncbi:MAG TPA: hydrogenase formation protein HypD [Thermoanaerobacterales bacterium]|nr:hydrogenase formation protein HypD [Thermoanaerobacterales bacterium]
MEVCGTHTMAVAKYGIKQLMPDTIKLISGPGCPVCVTPVEDIDQIIDLAAAGACIATFGDLMRVPGSFSTLSKERARGRDIRVVYSPLDALEIAARNPEIQVVFVGIGFETTAPAVALSIMHAKSRGIKNYSVLCLHKTMPQALRSLLDGGAGIDGFILPGHVCAITGIEPFEFLSKEYGIPGIVSGFEAKDIVESIGMIMKSLRYPKVDIQYRRAVKPWGNRQAQEVMEEVFETSDAVWRGLGLIKNSGLCIKKEWAEYDAKNRWSRWKRSPFAMKSGQVEGKDHKAENRQDSGTRQKSTQFYSKCKCGQVLTGTIEPFECPLFAKVCTPENPAGPCMVSLEGSCAAFYKYGTWKINVRRAHHG